MRRPKGILGQQRRLPNRDVFLTLTEIAFWLPDGK
jgi:hypothetical protein